MHVRKPDALREGNCLFKIGCSLPREAGDQVSCDGQARNL